MEGIIPFKYVGLRDKNLVRWQKRMMPNSLAALFFLNFEKRKSHDLNKRTEEKFNSS